MFEMWNWVEMLFLVILGICALEDHRERKVSIWLIGLLGVLSAGKLFQKTMIWQVWFLGILGGILFLLFSRYSDEKIGYGDSFTILVIGAFVGIWRLCSILFLSFLMLSILSMIQIRRKKWNRQTRVPFLPFLLIGYVGVLAW